MNITGVCALFECLARVNQTQFSEFLSLRGVASTSLGALMFEKGHS